MKTFSEAERQCRAAYDVCGEAYHAYTSDKEMPILFINSSDMAFVMNVVAYAAFIFKDSLRILAFEIMDNHFHFVISGTRQDIGDFFQRIVRKVKRTIPLAGQMKLFFKPVQDLSSMRELSGAQRLDVARTLHFDYRSSNGQIRRILGLSEYEINCLFPLSQNG